MLHAEHCRSRRRVRDQKTTGFSLRKRSLRTRLSKVEQMLNKVFLNVEAYLLPMSSVHTDHGLRFKPPIFLLRATEGPESIFKENSTVFSLLHIT
jgi:hypothetical protein